MVHGPLKEPLDFGGNPDRVILGLGVSRGRDMLHVCVCVCYPICSVITILTLAPL